MTNKVSLSLPAKVIDDVIEVIDSLNDTGFFDFGYARSEDVGNLSTLDITCDRPADFITLGFAMEPVLTKYLKNDTKDEPQQGAG